MRDGWEIKKLGDVLNFYNGKGSLNNLTNGSYHVYGSNGKIGTSDKFLYDIPSLIIGRVGAYCGSVMYTKEKFWATDNTIISNVKNNTEDELGFYYYLLCRLNLNNRAGGSAQPLINQTLLASINIYRPPLPTQKKIATILSSLDDKIELNLAINKTLEEMANTLFKHWFVDFNFDDEHGKPYKASGGKMIDSQLGSIPDGWSVKVLSDIGNVITGKTPSTQNESNFSGTIPFITIPDMHNKVFIENAERSLSEEGHNAQPKKLIPKNSIMVSCIATVGLVAINPLPSHTNQQINTLTLNDFKGLYYYFNYLKYLNSYLQSLGAGGTATLNINKDTFEKIKIIVPIHQIIYKYNDIVENLYAKILKNQQENETLTKTRDLLLPKLLSGTISV